MISYFCTVFDSGSFIYAYERKITNEILRRPSNVSHLEFEKGSLQWVELIC